MLNIVTMLWDFNKSSLATSRCYDESWVEKLYRGFYRNLTEPFRFVVFTDRHRSFREPAICQEQMINHHLPDYGCFTEPYRLNKQMIFVGLDTIITGNIDHMAAYCFSENKIALCRDPYQPTRSINGVALVPGGYRFVYDEWTGENDMEHLRKFSTNFIDDLWPGQVLSCKFHDVRRLGLQDAKIVYFHGRPKPHELGRFPWIRDHWR